MADLVVLNWQATSSCVIPSLPGATYSDFEISITVSNPSANSVSVSIRFLYSVSDHSFYLFAAITVFRRVANSISCRGITRLLAKLLVNISSFEPSKKPSNRKISPPTAPGFPYRPVFTSFLSIGRGLQVLQSNQHQITFRTCLPDKNRETPLLGNSTLSSGRVNSSHTNMLA